jgi:tetratricopeptide (TPR) repeat protein
MFDNKTFDELNVIAMDLVSNNQWDDTAIDVNKKMIGKKSKDHSAHTRLAKCLLVKGDRQGAYDIYKKVLEFDPKNTISYNFVKAEEFSVRKEEEKKENDERIAKELDGKRIKKEKIKRMISEI